MARPGHLSRSDILDLLKPGLKLEDSHELVRSVGVYLRDTKDIEVLKKTLKVFNIGLEELFPIMNNSEYVDLADVCPDSLGKVKEWLEVTRKTEPPGIYHALSFLTIVSALMGFSRYIDRGHYRVYPPMATILVGPSGARKGTAINLAMKFYYALPIESELKIIREKITAEALVTRATNTDDEVFQTLCWLSPELSVSLGRQSYLVGIAPLLTRLLDNDGTTFEASTQKHSTVVVKNTLLSFLGGTAEDWFSSAITTDIIKGGMTSRILFPVIRENTRMFWKSHRIKEEKIFAFSEDVALGLNEGKHEVTVSGTAEEYMEMWYFMHRGQEESQGGHDLDRGYYHRKHIHVLRIAMVLAFLRGSIVIEVPDLEGALFLLEFIEKESMPFFARLLSGKINGAAYMIHAYYKDRSRKTITRKDIYEDFGGKYEARQLKEIIDYLIESESIQLVPNTTSTYKVK